MLRGLIVGAIAALTLTAAGAQKDGKIVAAGEKDTPTEDFAVGRYKA